MARQEPHCIWCTIVGLTILVSLLVISKRVNAQASEGCSSDGSQIAILAQKALAKHGRVAEFNTLFVPGGKTAEIILHEPYEQERKYTFYVAVSSDQSTESRALDVYGIDKIVKDEKVQTRLIVSVPDAGWRWPQRVFFVLGCTADGKPALAAKLSALVGNRSLSAIIAIGVVVIVYVGVVYEFSGRQGFWTVVNAFRLTAGRQGFWTVVNAFRLTPARQGFWTVANPFELTKGLTGRGSIANLQTFFFTLIVVGLVAYSLARRGVLSDLSTTVVWLLGIVAGGTVVARGLANVRDQLSSTNLKHLQALGWIPAGKPSLPSSDTSLETLVSRDGELDVTRMQALAFSLVVGVALIVRGVTDLAHFEVPENLLILLGASQAIYLGGKWVQPDKSGEQFAELNKLLDEMRALELKVREEAAQALVDATLDSDRQTAITKATSFNKYHAMASTAADQVANLLVVKRPTAGLFGVPI